MSKRKYSVYIVASEFCEDEFENYNEAFSKYNRSKTATMYGIPYDETCCEVIMSK